MGTVRSGDAGGARVIEDFVAELSARLESLGVRGADARRVLVEARDHLEQAAGEGVDDPVRQFGDPKRFARLVAAELATKGTRRAAFGTFGALSIAGSAYVLAFALVPAAGGWPDLFSGRVAAIGPILAPLMAVLPQIAFVSGCLALIQALRLRAGVFGAAELALLRRRSNVALVTAAGTLVAVAAWALESSGELAGWWTWTTLAACATAIVPVTVAARAVAGSARPAAEPAGPAGDIFLDLEPVFRLGPLRRLDLRSHPWRFATLSAAAVGLLGFLGGWYAEGDPGSGIVRGALEALALLVCFAVLGRILGLRRPRA
jgi:hypothetical protein